MTGDDTRWTFDQKQRSVGAVSQWCHLQKQATVKERGGQIAVGPSLHEHFAIHEVIAGSQTVHFTSNQPHRRAASRNAESRSE